MTLQQFVDHENAVNRPALYRAKIKDKESNEMNTQTSDNENSKKRLMPLYNFSGTTDGGRY